MGMDLRSKLEMYKMNQQSKAREVSAKGPDIHELVKGTVCSSDDGSFFLIEKKYPFSYAHGGYRLGEAFLINTDPLMKACKEDGRFLPVHELGFLDTETTGLAGGTGTVAFLIGLGFFTNDAFILQQYVIRDYNEEFAALKALNQVLSSKKGLVTFNGKSFDWNLLHTRFTFNRIRNVLRDPVHLDLLYPARTLWKLKLESCKLSSLEENILHLTRIDDIPGAMIPGIYFKYLEDRNALELKKVITHNEIDILSMVSLMTRIYSILINPLGESRDPQELLGAGNLFKKYEDAENALLCYRKCTTSDSFSIKESSLKKLADIYKKGRDYVKAVEHLEAILVSSQTPNIPVMIELAKHYEHRLKDIPRALSIVQTAVNVCSGTAFLRKLYLQDLKKRLNRLRRKHSPV